MYHVSNCDFTDEENVGVIQFGLQSTKLFIEGDEIGQITPDETVIFALYLTNLLHPSPLDTFH